MTNFNKGHFWSLNEEPSIYSLGRVQNHPANSALLRKITIWVVNWARNYMMKMYGIWIYQNQVYSSSLCTWHDSTSSFVPKSVVLELTTLESEYCFRFLLHETRYSSWGTLIAPCAKTAEAPQKVATWTFSWINRLNFDKRIQLFDVLIIDGNSPYIWIV